MRTRIEVRPFKAVGKIVVGLAVIGLLSAFNFVRMLLVNPVVVAGGSGASFAYTGSTAPGSGLTWDVLSPSSTTVASSSSANGWSVSFTSPNFTVSAPATATIAAGYTVRYQVGGIITQGQGSTTGGGPLPSCFQVRNGPHNYSASFDVVGPPPAPTGLTATPGTGQIGLSWTASSGATSYSVWRSTTSGSGYSSIASGVTPTSYTDSSVTAGITYYYVVKATNSYGTSGNSNQASATPLCNAPTNLTATGDSLEISLSWTASVGASGYTILRSTTSGSGYASIGTTTTATTYTDGSVTPGTTYYYVVRATDAAGSSGFSNEASADPTVGSPDAIQAYAGDTTATLFWGDVQFATSYTVNRSLSMFGTPVATFTTASTSFTDTGLQNGVTYYYTVNANGAGGAGPMSWTECVPNPLPTFTASYQGQNVILTFTPYPGAQDYEVLRSTSADGPFYSYDYTLALTYTDTAVTAGSTYYYQIFVQCGFYCSDNSAVQSVTALAAAPVLTATPGDSQVALNWTSVAGAVSYQLSRSTDPRLPYVTIANTANQNFLDTSGTDSNGVHNNVTYYYKVVAVAGNGSLSSPGYASATPIGASSLFVYPVNDQKNYFGFLDNALTLPDWEVSSVPTDETTATGSGPSSGLSVSLPFGVLESYNGPDIVVSNPAGPDLAFERTYRSVLQNAGISSDGLPPGWVNNWDYRIYYTTDPNQWGSLTLVYPSGASDILTP